MGGVAGMRMEAVYKWLETAKKKWSLWKRGIQQRNVVGIVKHVFVYEALCWVISTLSMRPYVRTARRPDQSPKFAA